MSRSPTLAEVLNNLRTGIMRDLRVALPGRVENFDETTNTADVQPMVKETRTDDDGGTTQVSLPVLTGVPVMYPGGGGLRITFPIQAGDFVLLIFGDRSLDAFLDQGQESGPADQRRHNLSDAVAYAGLRPTNSAWKGIEDTVITLGLDAGTQSDFVALATKVKNEISALRDTVRDGFNALSGHTHDGSTISTTATIGPSAVVGVQSGMTGAGPTLTGPAAVGDVGNTAVKVRD